MDVDWICIGSGAGGCAAALAGHDRGMSTLLVEGAGQLGGMTSSSGGILWAPGNHLMAERGIPDSRKEALDYLRFTGAGENLDPYMESYVDHSARVLRWLGHDAGVALGILDLDEFFPAGAGAKARGRLVGCEPLPAEGLGAWRDRVRLSPFHHGFGDLLEGHDPALGGGDGPHVGHSGPVRGAAGAGARAAWREHLDREELDARLQADEHRRVAGASLAAHLVRAVAQRGIPVRTGAVVRELCVEGRRVVGAVVESDGTVERIGASRGVLLATGVGDGWRSAVPAGAAVAASAVRVGLLGIQVPGELDGEGRPLVRANYELRMRHGLVVNRAGRRFGNEAFFQDMAARLQDFDSAGEHRYVNLPCYLVFDRSLVESYSFAGLPPGTRAGLEWVPQAGTPEALAERIGVPAPALTATLERFNGGAERGIDPDFGRPAPSLGPVERPPFYAVRLTEPDLSAGSVGLVADTAGRVLDGRDSAPIPGLYACGQVVETRRTLGAGYQAGCQLMLALVFGVLAAEQAADA